MKASAMPVLPLVGSTRVVCMQGDSDDSDATSLNHYKVRERWRDARVAAAGGLHKGGLHTHGIVRRNGMSADSC